MQTATTTDAEARPGRTPAEAITFYSRWAAGAGLVPLPVLDVALVGAIQIKMIADLAAQYGVPFSETRGKALIASTVGTVVPYGLVNGVSGLIGSLVKAVPVLGPVVAVAFVPSVAWASTRALGNVFAQHFATGGSLLDFDPDKVRDHFRQEFDAAKIAGVPANG